MKAWLAAFLANCRADKNRRTTDKLLELGELSRRAMAALEPVVPLESFQWRDAGKLVVYRTRAAFDAAIAKPDAGGTRQVWTAAECVAREPALAALEDKLAGGIYNSGEAVADCYAFCVALADRLVTHPRFDGFIHGEAPEISVTDFEHKCYMPASATSCAWRRWSTWSAKT